MHFCICGKVAYESRRAAHEARPKIRTGGPQMEVHRCPEDNTKWHLSGAKIRNKRAYLKWKHRG